MGGSHLTQNSGVSFLGLGQLVYSIAIGSWKHKIIRDPYKVVPVYVSIFQHGSSCMFVCPYRKFKDIDTCK